MRYLRQSTAATVKIGPFLDSTDAVTPETGLTILQADVRLSKNGGDCAQKNEASAATHDEIGYYDCPIDIVDTGTVGHVRLAVNETGALPVWEEFVVLPALVYDALIGGSDYLQVHAREIDNGLITAAAIATGAIDADAVATDAVDEISAGNWNYATGSGRTLSAGAIVLGTFSAALQAVIAYIDAAISSRSTLTQAQILSDATPFAGAKNVAAIKAKTDNIPASPAATGAKMDVVDAPNATGLAAFAAAVWNRLTSALTVAGSIGKALADLLAVFNATTRTLTQSAAAVTAAVAGPNLAVTRFVTYTATLTGLTIPATWSVIWLTAKGSKKDPDASAQFMVRVTNGGAATDRGQYYNKTAATVTTRPYAGLTVDQPAGSIGLLIQDNGTALLADATYYYDAKCLLADGSIQQVAGRAKFSVDSSYTQALA